MKKTIMILAAASMTLAACQKNSEEFNAQIEGTIDLNFTPEISFVTKASTAITPEQKKEYKVTISEKSGNTIKYGPDTIENFENANQKFPAGTYVVKVENITEEESKTNPVGDASFGQAWINGSNEVTVQALNNPVTVNCTPKNTKVTVAKAAGFEAIFKDITIELSCDGDKAPERKINYTTAATHESAKPAFFMPGTLSCKITVTPVTELGSAPKTINKTFTLSAAQWTKITLNANSDGSLNVTINIDTDYGSKDESVELNPYN